MFKSKLTMKKIPIKRCYDCESFTSACNDIKNPCLDNETCFNRAVCGVNGESLINFELPEIYREFPDYDGMDYIRSIPKWCPRPNKFLIVTKCVQCLAYLQLELEGQPTLRSCCAIEVGDDRIKDPWVISEDCPLEDV